MHVKELALRLSKSFAILQYHSSIDEIHIIDSFYLSPMKCCWNLLHRDPEALNLVQKRCCWKNSADGFRRMLLLLPSMLVTASDVFGRRHG
jgi:hypothetical protein